MSAKYETSHRDFRDSDTREKMKRLKEKKKLMQRKKEREMKRNWQTNS